MCDHFISIKALNQPQCKMQTKPRLYFDRYQSTYERSINIKIEFLKLWPVVHLY